MLDLEELRQLAAFARWGTLSRAAEELHISQPTLSRTMQSLEEEFGVSLFVREKNKIELNETGRRAVEAAKELLREAEETVRRVREYDRRLHTIAVESCAPAPMWALQPQLTRLFPGMSVSASLEEVEAIPGHVTGGSCDLGILPGAMEAAGVKCVPFLREELYVCLPPDHPLAGCASVTFEMLNGYNCLLRSQIGFWDAMSRRKMPASRFLVQTDAFEMRELIRSSSLPCFTTNLVNFGGEETRGRAIIPIQDAEAQVGYHLIYREACREYDAIRGGGPGVYDLR